MTKRNIFIELKKALKEYNDKTSPKKKLLTPDFNLVNILSPKELQLSQIIAEFLNPKGTHEQGKIFLNEFIKLFVNKNSRLLKSKEITVSIELSQSVEGQIDIVIDFDKNFGIAVENKPFADDQDRQIIRYVDYLKNTYGDENYLMIYLSAQGNSPTEKSLPKIVRKELGNKFLIISYVDMRNWLISCAKQVKEKQVRRLEIMILEFVEYINLEFLNINKIKSDMLSDTIKNNVLDAFEVNKLWEINKKDFLEIWEHEVNELFNNELSQLVFTELIKRNVIDNNWELIEGNFDISKQTVGGFGIKKKDWKNFSYTINKAQNKGINGSVKVFPAIQTAKKANENLTNIFKNQLYDRYISVTKTKKPTVKDLFWSKPPIIWWTDFADNEYSNWDYSQWIEIKSDGKTVEYVADFFEKLMTMSQSDIEKLENERIY